MARRPFPDLLWETQAASVLDLQKAAQACVSVTRLQIFGKQSVYTYI